VNEVNRRGELVVVSGFSGAGKGTLMKALVQKYDDYSLSVSMTTRQPRVGEVDGQSYFFVSRDEFEEQIKEDGFLEYACYCENYYGTPRSYVDRQLSLGKDVILEIEIQGAMRIKDKYPSAILLFVMPPSGKELRRRLIGRGTESIEIIDKRLSRACEEAEGIEAYDYIVINDKLETCVDELDSIIRSAHKSVFRNHEIIEKIRTELREFQKEEK
jgi:guanylate kinase